MASDTAKLQKAVFSHLASDTVLTGLLGGTKIYDRPATSASLPYLTLGITRAFDASTASETGQEHLFTVHAWSRKGGRKETASLMDAVRLRLQSLGAVQDAMRIVSLRFKAEDVTYNEQISAYQGTLRFRAFTEAEIL
jgi:hypothetical protein